MMLGMHVNSQIYGWASFYIKGKEIVDVRYINFCLKVPIRSHHSCNFLSENYRVSNNRLSLTFAELKESIILKSQKFVKIN